MYKLFICLFLTAVGGLTSDFWLLKCIEASAKSINSDKMTYLRINFVGILVLIICFSCNAQVKNNNMTNEENVNFSCDIETAECKPSDDSGIEEINLKVQPKVKLIYYTDPICSACWAIEPALKRFKLEYGDYLEIEYRMGGLLPGWEGFADKNNSISKPSDVAHHWDEVGQQTGMSIDGDIWLEDPLDSSFPPSIAFKAAQKQGEEFALRFLRKIREQVFLEKKNITKEHFLVEAIEACQGDTAQFLTDYHDESTKQSFHEEMKEGKKFGVRGFPTFIFIGNKGKGFKISGTSGYKNYVIALEKALGEKAEPKPIQLSELDLLNKYKFLATKEVSFILSQNETTTLSNLNNLVELGEISNEKHKYGDFWRIAVSSN